MEKILTYIEKAPGIALLAGFVIGYFIVMISFFIFFVAAIFFILVVLFGHDGVPGIGKYAEKSKRKEAMKDFDTRYGGRVKNLLRNVPFFAGLIIGAVVGYFL